MATRSVDEINITNWTNLGTTSPVPRWAVNIEIKWTTEGSVQNTHDESVVFPNILSAVPNSRLKQYMEEIILRELRIQQGIDIE